ncbi:M20/M25/M40 family metallo-hydrolase [Salinimicrobium sediminilitoris]|uniref:M20/M25/M40 family metallo-hydrolase n=1 Tax=Salinimicrobium sediminilitoris TaxID=2876715 RepID=UPI001E5C1A32|nr:M20/M25/M40 family metallo-hydrolase [Salinimicrobium sediminilitoris]MCC8359747.1 M20/M25/M40 family metallo-hydrolase [Salinimicrobium sediminilitoris]
MSKQIQAGIALLIIISGVIWSFSGTRPQVDLSKEVPAGQFSTARAFEHVEALAQEPHYVGSAAHSKARNYIVDELEQLGLLIEMQEGFSLNREGTLVRAQNILARIQGTGDGPALLLMSHYDSAMHSSPGASDAASGVATILEGIRAYRTSGKVPENDIILLFTDAEELGLNGADLFTEEHPWAKEVGLALNFESRGSGGNSFMLLETNSGNQALINHFSEAGVQFPVTNSLAYSVYKMLPNDTDLTVLREQGNINGFNFAFIDDHFDYHTATDVPGNLDLRTLAHQGSYLMPLLNYSASVPLDNFSSEEDVLFFNLPGFNFIKYPYSWIMPMVILSFTLLLGVIIYGLLKRRLEIKSMVKGFLPLLLSLFLVGILGYFLWELVLWFYPQYKEMEHGFTYNGYWYIGAVIFLALAVCFYVYHKFRKPQNSRQLLVAPLILWWVISVLAAVYLKGAAYFIIPVLFGIIQLLIMIFDPKWKLPILAFLSLPVIFILMPFIVSFPVALGLGMLVLTAVLVNLLFVLLWPVFGAFRNNQLFGFLSFLVFMVLFVIAHFKSDFNEDRPRPNSLVYLADKDKGVATWNTYEEILDDYTAPYFENALEAQLKHWFGSKNGSNFSKTAVAPQIMLPEPYVSVQKAVIEPEGEDVYNIKIAPNRDINRIELFADKGIDFNYFKANAKEAGDLRPGSSDLHVHKNRWWDNILTYYAVSKDTLRLELSVEEGIHPEITLLEASYDLHENPQLQVPARADDMIPRPFVLNDAIVVKRTFKLE